MKKIIVILLSVLLFCQTISFFIKYAAASCITITHADENDDKDIKDKKEQIKEFLDYQCFQPVSFIFLNKAFHSRQSAIAPFPILTRQTPPPDAA